MGVRGERLTEPSAESVDSANFPQNLDCHLNLLFRMHTGNEEPQPRRLLRYRRIKNRLHVDPLLEQGRR